MRKKRSFFLMVLYLSMVSSGFVGVAIADDLVLDLPVQMTMNSYYERGPSIVYGNGYYWLFYGRSYNCQTSYEWEISGFPVDGNHYEIYYKKSTTIAGLSCAIPQSGVREAGATDVFNGETGAVYFDGKVWVFASVPSRDIEFPNRNALYAWCSTDGSFWTEVGPYWDNKLAGSLHHDEIVFNEEVWAFEGASDGAITTRHGDPANPGAWASTTDTVVSGSGGIGRFLVDNGELYLGIYAFSNPPKRNQLYKCNGTAPWNLIDEENSTSNNYDAALLKVGNTFIFARATIIPASVWGWARQWITGMTSNSLTNLLSFGTSITITEALSGENVWADMLPYGFNDAGSYIFYGSEINPANLSLEIAGNIWMTKITFASSMASFIVKEAKIDFKKKSADDKIHAKGKFELDLEDGNGLDFLEEVIVTIGNFSEKIVMNTKDKGKKWNYKRDKGGSSGIKEMKIEWKKDKAKFDIHVDKADIGEMSCWINPVTVSIQIGGYLGTEDVIMREHKHHWDYH